MKKISREILYAHAELMDVKVQFLDRIPFYGYERLRKRILGKVYSIVDASCNQFRMAQHESYAEYEKGLE